MKDILKYILLFGGGWFGLELLQVYRQAKKLIISYSKASLEYFNKNEVRIGFWLTVQNPSNEQFVINNSNLKIYLNTQYAGDCIIPYQQVIRAGEKSEIVVLAVIRYRSIFSEWWNLFLQGASNVQVRIAGSLKLNKIYAPIPAIDIYNFNLTEAISKAINN